MMRVNKIMMALGIFLFCGNLGAQELRTEVFDLLDLTRPGLEKVRAAHEGGDDAAAAADLLEYYRSRKGICTPEIRNVKKVKINKEQQKWADDALQHTFFVHKGYQPSFNYGEDIDWEILAGAGQRTPLATPPPQMVRSYGICLQSERRRKVCEGVDSPVYGLDSQEPLCKNQQKGI